jgi:hypothetical protein
MTTRTINKTVTFEKPFLLGSLGKKLPAGDYEVVTEEELLEGLSFYAYRRLQTYIYGKSKPGEIGLAQSHVVDPAELDAALTRDQAIAKEKIDEDDDHEATDQTTEKDMEFSDREAMERASDDGMRVEPG